MVAGEIPFQSLDEELGMVRVLVFIVSGYLMGVNPFDQPGVEEYKKNMFALIGKPGYEERLAQLMNR